MHQGPSDETTEHHPESSSNITARTTTQQPGPLVTLSSAVYQAQPPDTASQGHRKVSSSGATSARLPRTSSLLPPTRAGAAAATTNPASLIPKFSPGQDPPPFKHENSSIGLVTTPLASQPLRETKLNPAAFSSSINLPVLSLPFIEPLGPIDENIGNPRSSSPDDRPGGNPNKIEIAAEKMSKAEVTVSTNTLPSMSHEQGPELQPSTYGHTRQRSGKGSGDSGRHHKPPSQKAMLSRALQKANTAVQLDNSQNFTGARQHYSEACELLHHVLQKTNADEDKRKLEAIRRTYSARIEELDQMTPWQATSNKELPAPPANISHKGDRTLSAGVAEVGAVNPLDQLTDESASSQFRKKSQDLRHQRENSQEASRSLRQAEPSLQSSFSRSPARPRFQEDHTHDNHRTPQPIYSRRASSPLRLLSDRYDTDQSLHSSSWSDTRDGVGHLRDGSQNSWLDPIDESGGSTNTSIRSRASSAYPRKHLRTMSGNTEAEFDTALDAAIEAAYDEGYEPMDLHSYDTVDRTEDIVTKALRKVEAARERVRQTERETYAADHQRRPSHQLRRDNSGAFYDDLSSDEEERILEEMTRDYDIEDFIVTEERTPMVVQHPDSRDRDAIPWLNDTSKCSVILGTKSLATTVDRQHHPVPKGLQPSAPPPKQSLPDLPLARAPSPEQSVRGRRLSGQNPKQLKIQTTQLQLDPDAKFEEEAHAKSATERVGEEHIGERPRTSRSATRKLTPPTVELPVSDPIIVGSPPQRSGPADADGLNNQSGSPTINRLRKNFSSSSLRSLKGRNMSLSNPDDAPDMSPSTPSSNFFGANARTLAIPGHPVPQIASLRDHADSSSPAAVYLFEDNIHPSNLSGSPTSMIVDPPVPLEPCPNDVMLRPFWLMRCLYQTLVHSRGGYLSTKLFVPREVWKVKGVKLKNVDDKVSNCDLLTAALQKLSKVDTCDADAVLDEMQSLEGVLEQVQTALTRKLGNDVGVQGSGVLFKEASNVVEGDGAPAMPRTGSVSSKSSFSWRRLRPKNSNIGLGGAYNTRITGGDFSKEPATMPTLPMTPQPTRRPPKRHIDLAQFIGPNATYMASLARLFDAAQAIDQIARQVDDPGLRHADKTQVGLELCTRHAAEFFGFYICRFVLTDLGMLLDKFIKRGSEWVLT